MPPNMARKERFSLDHAPIFFSSSDRPPRPYADGRGRLRFSPAPDLQAPAGKT
jgi:hypothetical protein